MAVETILIESDNLITVDGLQDQTDSSYINDATVTVTLLDSADTEVSGQTWPLTLTYVAASNGKYQGTLTDSLSLSNRKKYTAKLIADAGAGRKRTWWVPARAARGE